MKLRTLISLLLAAVLLGSCHREPLDIPKLTLTLEVPAGPAYVKADVPASDTENAIHDLKLWVFNHNTHEKVAYLALEAGRPAEDYPQPGEVKRYSLPVDWTFALARPRPTLDVYVIANTASFGESVALLSETAPWGTVSAVSFGGADYFSPENPIHTVPSAGLPMSGVGTNLSLQGEEPSLRVSALKLKRAVSKVGFYFCQMKTVSDNAADEADMEYLVIDKVVLGGEQIPVNQHVFAEAPPAVAEGGYVNTAMETELGESTPICQSETPELYSYKGAGQTGVEYEAILNDAVAENKLTHAGTTYLRESDKALSGEIHYRIRKGDGTWKTPAPDPMPFQMSSNSDFSRNHTWIVYGYYLSNRTMELSVSVLPWEKTDYNIDFTTDALMVTQKLTVMPETVASVEYAGKVGGKDHYNVTLKKNQPGKAYLYVLTPQGGILQIIPQGTDGSELAFSVSPKYASIDPKNHNGRIEISIDRNLTYEGTAAGKSITLGFRAFTNDFDREIPGASEAIDQVYHFIIPKI